MEYEVVNCAGLSRVGESVVTTNEMEMTEGQSRIGPLWGRFYTRCKGAPEGQPIAVYDQYASDHRGAYRITLSDEGDLADGTRVEIPAGRYARFVSEGDQPQALIETWQRVWELTESGALHRAFTTDYEHHVSDRRVEVYIAVE